MILMPEINVHFSSITVGNHPWVFTVKALNRVGVHLDNLEKSREFHIGQGLYEKSGKLWFACDVLPQLRQSQSKQPEYC